jgi:site-specific DNA recombinase
LTRSLADFAKLVELFDAHGVSFISVTQAVNTTATTSMGLLTLNMLLSFAQFEREITGERIRDKVAASKRKGRAAQCRSAIASRIGRSTSSRMRPNTSAAYFADISKRVASCASRPSSTSRTSARRFEPAGPAGPQAAKPFREATFAGYWILSNPIYVGRLRHKGQIHDGLHTAIVDTAIWDQVQQKLASQTQTTRTPQRDDQSFLAGKLFDDSGHRMGATYAARGGRRWRYYVSRATLTGRKQDAGSIARIPRTEGRRPEGRRRRQGCGQGHC